MRDTAAMSSPQGVPTRVAAALVEMTAPEFRKAMHRERVRGLDLRVDRDSWPDQRTPLWDADALAVWHRGRQRGPGRPSRGRHSSDPGGEVDGRRERPIP